VLTLLQIAAHSTSSHIFCRFRIQNVCGGHSYSYSRAAVFRSRIFPPCISILFRYSNNCSIWRYDATFASARGYDVCVLYGK